MTVLCRACALNGSWRGDSRERRDRDRVEMTILLDWTARGKLTICYFNIVCEVSLQYQTFPGLYRDPLTISLHPHHKSQVQFFSQIFSVLTGQIHKFRCKASQAYKNTNDNQIMQFPQLSFQFGLNCSLSVNYPTGFKLPHFSADSPVSAVVLLYFCVWVWCVNWMQYENIQISEMWKIHMNAWLTLPDIGHKSYFGPRTKVTQIWSEKIQLGLVSKFHIHVKIRQKTTRSVPQ